MFSRGLFQAGTPDLYQVGREVTVSMTMPLACKGGIEPAFRGLGNHVVPCTLAHSAPHPGIEPGRSQGVT